MIIVNQTTKNIMKHAIEVKRLTMFASIISPNEITLNSTCTMTGSPEDNIRLTKYLPIYYYLILKNIFILHVERPRSTLWDGPNMFCRKR